MPILYEGVNAEHETVRNAVFLTFSHGRILLTGPNALALIQKSNFKWLLP
jgi:aminomethyltransferase